MRQQLEMIQAIFVTGKMCNQMYVRCNVKYVTRLQKGVLCMPQFISQTFSQIMLIALLHKYDIYEMHCSSSEYCSLLIRNSETCVS